MGFLDITASIRMRVLWGNNDYNILDNHVIYDLIRL